MTETHITSTENPDGEAPEGTLENSDDESSPEDFTPRELQFLRGLYRDLFLHDIETFKTARDFLSALTGFAVQKKGITMRYCDETIIGFTRVRDARLNAVAKEDVSTIRDAWGTLLKKLLPANEGEKAEKKQDIIHIVHMLSLDTVTATQYQELMQTLFWNGLIWRDGRGYKVRPGYEEIYSKMKEAKTVLDNAAKQLKESFAAAKTQKEIEECAELARHHEFLAAVEGLYVNNPFAKGWGWHAWDQYLKAMSRVHGNK